MAKIKTIKKYDLNSKIWRDPLTLDEKKKSFAVASYHDIKNSDEDTYNYIIIADGCKVEDHKTSPDFTYIKDTSFGMSNIKNYFDKKKDNYKMRLVMVDIDGPQIDESIWLANYINRLSSRDDVKTVNFVGFSKCGLMGFNFAKYLSDEGLSKTRIYSVSSPYTGALLASPVYLKQECQKIFNRVLGENIITDKIIDQILKIHFDIFTDSHMDYDISIPGGISEDAMNRYDPRFLANIFSEENISAIHKVAHWQNICTHITDKTEKEIIKSGNLLDLGFCILNRFLFNKMADGIVTLDSQLAVDKHIGKKSKIIASPHSIMFTPLYFNQLLDIIDENMHSEETFVKKNIRNL